MKIFGTKCSLCGCFQLATEFQLGIKVKCSSCLRDFVCLDETVFLPFVKSTSNASAFKFDKKITNSFFTYGIGIPASMHDIVRSRLSKNIEIGEIMPAILRINQVDFPINLRYFENSKKEICLHLLWLNGSTLKQTLSKEYREQYEHFIVKGEVSGIKSWRVSVSLSEEEDVFILDEEKYGSNTSAPLPSNRREIRGYTSADEMNVDLILG